MNMKKHLVFLKTTGALFAELEDESTISQLDLSKFHVKTVNMSDTEVWQGDYSTGKIISVENRSIIKESELEYETNLKILREYPIHKQLNVIIDLIERANLPRTPEYELMREYISSVKAEHEEKISVYKSDPTSYVWYSTEEERQDIRNKHLT
jgi:hypothetical protein